MMLPYLVIPRPPSRGNLGSPCSPSSSVGSLAGVGRANEESMSSASPLGTSWKERERLPPSSTGNCSFDCGRLM